jgi:hypothetical protein
VSSAAPKSRAASTLAPPGNADFNWDNFDSVWYSAHNYEHLRDDDRQILEKVGDFFATMDAGKSRHGLDVGSGANLYPSLAMLPLCYRITLWERATSNVRWLREQVDSYAPSWDPFWQALKEDQPLYDKITRPRRALESRADVHQGSIFALPKSTWDIGTMFFVAESITSLPEEFQRATQSFVRSLRPGAPFAAAFMKRSQGYIVGAQRFPAVAIDEGDVTDTLRYVSRDLRLHTIDSTNLRDGYEGMILATGLADNNSRGSSRRR